MKKTARMIGLGIVFLWFMGGGMAHFTMTEFFVSIVPPWFPWPLAAVLISGIFEIALAILILIPSVRPIAGWALIALTLAVTPANIHMWMHPQEFPEASETLLTVRLVVQALLIILIWWSTRMPTNSAKKQR